MDKKGVTLIELIVIILIVGILATIAVTGYGRFVEHSRGQEAAANLELIYSAQKRFFLDNNTYLAAPTLAQINASLGLELTGTFFTYSTLGDARNFTATATRIGPQGICAGFTMTISDRNSEVQKAAAQGGCDAW